jgi:hypothetical protein
VSIKSCSRARIFLPWASICTKPLENIQMPLQCCMATCFSTPRAPMIS